MRIESAQAAAIHLDVGKANTPSQSAPRRIATTNAAQSAVESRVEIAKVAKPAIPQPNQLNVSVDEKQNVIYRFTDPNSGELVRQVPPEEILRIMRNIEDLLHESEQKLKVTL